MSCDRSVRLLTCELKGEAWRYSEHVRYKIDIEYNLVIHRLVMSASPNKLGDAYPLRGKQARATLPGRLKNRACFSLLPPLFHGWDFSISSTQAVGGLRDVRKMG